MGGVVGGAAGNEGFVAKDPKGAFADGAPGAYLGSGDSGP